MPGRTTTTLDIKTVDGTRTTSTRTQSTCDTIRGCQVQDDDWETTTTKSCTRVANRGFATVDTNPTPAPEPLVQGRAGGSTCETDNIIIYPQEYRIMTELRALLNRPMDQSDVSKTWESKSKVVGAGTFVAFIYIPNVPRGVWRGWQNDMQAHVSATPQNASAGN